MRAASDRSILITFAHEITPGAHADVVRAMRALAGIRGVVNLHPAYTTVLVEFDVRRVAPAAVEAEVRQRLAAAESEPQCIPRLVEIPVRYGGEDGPDLAFVAKHAGLTPRQVVELHTAVDYTVYFIGFSPGFPYLGGMRPALATPRLETPRKLVPAGSVAIGGAQTGVYPLASPGGWRLIGRTPERLFRPEADPPVLLEAGDRVRFVPVAIECGSNGA